VGCGRQRQRYRPDDGTGRRGGLKIRGRKACGFESRSGHHPTRECEAWAAPIARYGRPHRAAAARIVAPPAAGRGRALNPAGARLAAATAAGALLVNAALWGVSWWPFRQLQSLGLHSLWATGLVYLVVVAAVVAWRPGAPGLVLRTRSLWPLVLASGVSNACFNWAVTIGDVIRVVLLFYLMPAWAALLARWLLHEPMPLRVILRVLLAIAGAAVVLTPADAGWPLPRELADGLAIAGGMAFALTSVMLRREAEQPQEARAFSMFFGGLVVAGGLAVVLTLVGTIPAVPAPAAGWLVGVAALALMFGLGNLCLQYGAARLPANVTAVVLLSEVLFASVSAVALDSGEWSARLLTGGAMIVAAALLAVRDSAR